MSQPSSYDEDRNMPVHGAGIADAVAAVAAPTKAEFDAVVGKLNSLLAACREAGIIQLD